MKLTCNVQLYDANLDYDTKCYLSVLSLEKKVDPKYPYIIKGYLVWETEEKNPVKYLISTRDLYNYSKNLVGTNKEHSKSKKRRMHTFIMHFKNPLHCLIIQKINRNNINDTSLDKFAHLVYLMSDGWWWSFYESSTITSNFTLKTTKIKRKKKYPPKESFPRTTEKLILRKLKITELDPQIIVNLHSLKVLDLSYNQISFLPKELGTLPHLEKLDLSHNCLGNTCLEIFKWEWMEQTAISQSLKKLIINNNNLTELPLQVGNLQSLICLDVSYNLLTKMPQIIGTLQQLAWLNVAYNLLSYLPGSMRGMELCCLYTDNNPFRDLRIDEYRSPILKVVSLLDLAAKAVKKYRIPYNNLPSAMARYLNNSKYCCICRNPCFHSDIKDFNNLLVDRPSVLPLNLISNVIHQSFVITVKYTLILQELYENNFTELIQSLLHEVKGSTFNLGRFDHFILINHNLN